MYAAVINANQISAQSQTAHHQQHAPKRESIPNKVEKITYMFNNNININLI